MRSEIIAVGTELLLGQIANTNAQYLSQKLADEGIGVYFHTVVGDNRQRLLSVLKLAEARSDMIILTGGLGPTQDDLTKETVAELLNVQLIIDPAAKERIVNFFARRNQPMTSNNLRQALVLEGAHILPNDHGLAPGMVFHSGEKIYILLPGPPSEMKPMFEEYALPYLRSIRKTPSMLYSKVLRFFGIGESALVTELSDLIEGQNDPTIAPYAKEAEVTLRITTLTASAEEGEIKLKPVLAEIERRVGQFIYGEGEHTTLEGVLLHTLSERGQTFAAAESCTGGLISQMITSLPGASSVFSGGVVCYTNQAKHQLLQIDEGLLSTVGAVSAEVAKELARGIRAILGADYGISVTGVAGPDEVEEKPVGLVYVGIASKDHAEAIEYRFAGTRKQIQLRSAKTALFQLWKRLKER